MSLQEQSPTHKLHQYVLEVVVFGPLRPAIDLQRTTQRALKAHSQGRDFFTEITLRESRHIGGMRVDYTVTASSPHAAERAGSVYLSQLCDLLSVLTRAPVWFYMPNEDASEDRIRTNRRTTSIERILTEPEWSWITGNLVFLRREHPSFLAAASWYRKGIIGSDLIDNFCCFWRVIERLAFSYVDKSTWSEDERAKSAPRKCVSQLGSDLFQDTSVPEILGDSAIISRILKLRNDLSHGNIPVTLDVIDAANEYLKPLEETAFSVLQRIKQQELILRNP
jgi:hypothetical protein